MKTLFKLICTIVLILSVNSCGVSYQINDYSSNNVDPIYDVEVIETRSQLNWKLKTDWEFANNYYFFLQRQDFSFFHRQFYYNRLYRFGWRSPHDYWLNWQWGYDFGYSFWNGWNQYPYYGNWNTNYWWSYQNNYPYYSHIYGPRTSWLGNVYGRRGQSYRDRIGISSRGRSSIATTITNRNEKPRTIINKPVYTKPVNNKPVYTKPVSRPNKPIRVKPPTNNKPTWNNNSRPTNTRPVYNNNRPSNSNSRPVISKPTRSTTPQRSNSKRGG